MPVAVHAVAVPMTLAEAFARVAESSHEVVWLDSVRGDPDRGEQSLIVLQQSHVISVRAGDVRTLGAAHWREQLRSLDALFAEECAAGASTGLGWVGAIAYESACLFDDAFTLPTHVPDDALLVWCARAEVVARRTPAGLELVCGGPDEAGARALCSDWQAILETPQTNVAPAAPLRAEGTQLDRAAYAEAYGRVQEAIAAGQVYQACLTYAIRLAGPGNLAADYQRLRLRFGGDYSAYLRIGGLELASFSPERFLQVRGRRVVARPMKGTRPVSGDAAVDERMATELLQSEKERAENIMIVDLLRNDLGRVCEIGSVCVPRLFEVERYRTVLQLTSTVAGTLRAEVGPFGLLGATFPPGSMTGAPKVAACRLLATLEASPRGIYSGSVFWLGYDGGWDFSVVIRSVQRWAGELRWDTGGGIVADSQVDAEWHETRLKAAAILDPWD